MAFTPKISERGKYKFAEMVAAPGPQIIGEAGDNSYNTLFGREWLLVLDRGSLRLRIFQENDSVDGDWVEITEDIPAIFSETLPADARRISFAFDQSARLIVVYESAGTVKVTRWDSTQGTYLQNVNFSGTDPVLLNDANVRLYVPGSDVIIFYLPEDRSTLHYRLQREIYGVEHTLLALTDPVILDRALAMFHRYQLLLSDEVGDVLSESLLSDLYGDFYVGDDFTGSGTLAHGFYNIVRAFYEANGLDPILASGDFGDGIYTSNRLFIEETSGEAITTLGVLATAIYTVKRVFAEYTAEINAVTGTGNFPGAEYQVFRAFHTEDDISVMTGVGGLNNATYQEV